MRKAITKSNFFVLLSLFIIIALISIICINLFPFFIDLKNESSRLQFQQQIYASGFKGILILILIQTIQVFIAIIPGEIVELIAGFLYGTWGGLAICLIGNLLGSFLIFMLVSLFVKQYQEKLKDKLNKYDFLNNKKKVVLYLFILYLIPGIPKDIITYLVPFLPINFVTFIIVTSIARIPSIISSTYSSTAIFNNNYKIAIIILSIFAILATICFIFKDKILLHFKNKRKNDNTSK